MSDRRRLLLVVGIGRSGTSLFTGICGQLGWYVPQPEVEADESNPRGFGEPRWAVEFHTQLMRPHRVTNFDSRPVAFDLMAKATDKPEVAAKLTDWLSAQFEQSDEVVVKDPRVVWFLPLWRRTAEEMGIDASFATMLRHPTEVLMSARTSYGQWQNDASRAAGWLNVMLHVEQATRDTRRIFVRYDAVMADWRKELGRVGATIGAPGLVTPTPERSASVDAFVDPSLRRSKIEWNEETVPVTVRSMCERTWEELSALAAPDPEPARLAALDGLRADYERLYAEAEAIAQSSINASARRPGRAAASSGAAGAPAPGLRARIARLVPPDYRRRVPARWRRRLTGRAGR